jgi:hypothetical protein
MAVYRLTAVTAEGFGLTYSWGDAYEVEADSYEAAEADVLGRVGADDQQPYDRIVKAFVKDGWSWAGLELEES